jgi:ElaB/YqjD/DUF883 family membrane-anchored ribosome-binding protein
MNTKTMQAQAHNFGARAAGKIGSAVDEAGARVDAAIDYMSDKTQQVSEKIQRAREEGWDGVRRRTTDCFRESPFSAFLVTMGAGILVGWLLRKELR